ncbi:MAG: PEP-CTERM sorting domain-containing protein [Vicinamibacterales bacterium]|nr:PEP-CTERM sorting domain-containing protein [Vicinamibacterales bacterium]
MRLTSLRSAALAGGLLLALTAGTASAAPITLRSSWTFTGTGGGSGFATCTDGAAAGDGCAGTTYSAGTSGGTGLGFNGSAYDFSAVNGGFQIGGALGNLANYTVDIVYDIASWAGVFGKVLSFDGNTTQDEGVWAFGNGIDVAAITDTSFAPLYLGGISNTGSPYTLRTTRSNALGGNVSALYWGPDLSTPIAPAVFTGASAVFDTNSAFFFSDGVGIDDIPTGSLMEIRFYEGSQLDQVPEPASMMLMGTGLLGVANTIRRRRKQTESAS